jgi:hypothetical protein
MRLLANLTGRVGCHTEKKGGFGLYNWKADLQ